jgi:PIN domain nuclease of toxin-antitoxin system
MSVVLDTHAIIWYLENSPELSLPALEAIHKSQVQGTPLYISAITLIEIIYLVERGRIRVQAFDRLDAAQKDPSSGLIVVAVDALVSEAVIKVKRQLVPDMPDRIIAATALYLGLPLVTRDRKIQASGILSIW